MTAGHAPVGLPVSATAYAPGGVGNLGPGLDILGLAIAGAGDTVRAGWSNTSGVTVVDPGHPALSRDPGLHASAIAAAAVLRTETARARAGQRGVWLRVTKQLPLAGGQGGSAASALAGAVAVDALLDLRLSAAQLLEAALDAESRLAGRHLDNLAAALYGGIVLVRSLDPIEVVELPVPHGLCVVLAQPDQHLRTADARQALPRVVDRDVAVHQAAQVAAMVAALARGDLALLGRALDDRIAEPARAPLLPGFAAAKHAALAAGALGASISGAGPTAFALAADYSIGVAVASAMERAYTTAGVACRARVAFIDRRGAYADVVYAGDEEPATDPPERVP